MVTIHDIAERLGVNASTVSRALGKGTGVGRELREKIRNTAEEMGYRPNLVARQLRQQTSSVIGLIVDEEWNWYASSITDGVQHEARANDTHVMIWNARSPEDQEEGIRLFEQMRLSGIVVASMHLDAKNQVLHSSLPIVLINRVGGTEVPSVLSDDEYGTVLVMSHLLALGHKDIAFINGPEDWPQSAQRLHGVHSALGSAHLSLKSEWYGSGDWRRESGQREAYRILNTTPRPTAIFSANDLMAVGVYDVARELGIGIPEELSVIGYDNHPACEYLSPQLTTITLPNWEMGSIAVKTLFHEIRNAATVLGPQMVKGELVVRDSTAAP